MTNPLVQKEVEAFREIDFSEFSQEKDMVKFVMFSQKKLEDYFTQALERVYLQGRIDAVEIATSYMEPVSFMEFCTETLPDSPNQTQP